MQIQFNIPSREKYTKFIVQYSKQLSLSNAVANVKFMHKINFLHFVDLSVELVLSLVPRNAMV